MSHDPRKLLDLWVEESISLNHYESAIKHTDNPNLTPLLEDCAQSHQQRQTFLHAKLGTGKIDANELRDSQAKASKNGLIDVDDESTVVQLLLKDELQRLDKYRAMHQKGFSDETPLIEKLLLPEQERVVSALQNFAVLMTL